MELIQDRFTPLQFRLQLIHLFWNGKIAIVSINIHIIITKWKVIQYILTWLTVSAAELLCFIFLVICFTVLLSCPVLHLSITVFLHICLTYTVLMEHFTLTALTCEMYPFTDEVFSWTVMTNAREALRMIVNSERNKTKLLRKYIL